MKKDFSNWIKDVQYDIKLYPKKFWKYFGTYKDEGRIPKKMFCGNFSAGTREEISTLFAVFFRNVFKFYQQIHHSCKSNYNNKNNNIFINLSRHPRTCRISQYIEE